jgi:6,7-dimethyl-8-ribityllumazine synthase
VQLDAGVPIANGILTTDTEEQALQRVRQKGSDCAAVAVEMAILFGVIRNEKRTA